MTFNKRTNDALSASFHSLQMTVRDVIFARTFPEASSAQAEPCALIAREFEPLPFNMYAPSFFFFVCIVSSS